MDNIRKKPLDKRAATPLSKKNIKEHARIYRDSE
jgi:hypothetical protein